MSKQIFSSIIMLLLSVVVWSAPVAQWHFDESSGQTVANDSIGTISGTLNGSAVFVAGGVSGNCVYVASSGNGLVNMGDAFAFAGDFSIVAWFKMEPSQPANGVFLSKHQTGIPNGYLLGLNEHFNGYGTAGKIWFYYGGGPGQQPTSTTSVNDGNWHQVAAVYRPGFRGEIYVDGAPVEQILAPLGVPAYGYAAPFLIGGIYASAPTGAFDGYIDEVQLYSHALSSTDIQYLYEHPASVAEAVTEDAELTFWLKAETAAYVGDGNPVPVWYDSSDNHYDMTHGYETFRYPTYVANAVNGQPAVRFDGDDFYYRHDIPGYTLTSPSRATAFVVLREATSQPGNEGRNTVFSWCNGNVSSSERFLLHTPWDNIIALQHGNVYAAQGNWTVPADWDDNWHILEFVREEPIYQCLIDGVDQGIQAGSNVLNVSLTQSIYIGNDWWGNTFTGDVGEIRIYNGVLTADQRQQIRRSLSQQYGIAIARQPRVVFRDDFRGTMSGAWQILHKDMAYYSAAQETLNLRACAGDIWSWRTDYKNLFLIDTPTDDDFMMTVKLNQFSPTAADYSQLDLIAYDDDDNLVRCIYGHVFGGRHLEFGAEISGGWSNQLSAIDFGSNPFWFRLRKTDNKYIQYYSTDGSTFIAANNPVSFGDGTPAKIGFAAMVDPTETSTAYVDYVEVVEMTAGDVNQNGCVRMEDVNAISSQWLSWCGVSNNWCLGADMNYSGQVYMDDVIILADHWLEGN